MDEELEKRFEEAKLKYGPDWINKSMSRSFRSIMLIMHAKPIYIDLVVSSIQRKEVTAIFEVCQLIHDKLFTRIQKPK